jgi:predicted peptidase
MNLRKLLIPALFGLSIGTTGCSTSQTVNTTTNSPPSNTTEQNSKDTSHADGDLISLISITVPHTNSDVKTYKLMYWSHNTRTEAFLAVPKYAGMYPLSVFLHGGADTAYPKSHYSSPASSTTLEYAGNGFITLVPEYRGYADSDGTIPNLQGEVLDVDNAIKALQSTVYSVEPNHIYLEGTSMGGAVALQLSAERNDKVCNCY